MTNWMWHHFTSTLGNFIKYIFAKIVEITVRIISANTVKLSCSTACGSPPWCPLQVVSCVSLQRERRWWSQTWWDQRGWAQEAPLLPPLEWTNINSVTGNATSTKQHDVKENVLIRHINYNICLYFKNLIIYSYPG